jgi:hypothetical protein
MDIEEEVYWGYCSVSCGKVGRNIARYVNSI